MSKEEVEAAFRAALKRNAKAKEVAAAAKMLDKIQEMDLKADDARDLLELLDRCFSSPNFLKADKCKKFLTGLALAFMFRVGEVALAIKEALLKTTEPLASAIGDVFANAWVAANASERSSLKVTLLRQAVEQGILSASPAMNRNCRAFMDAFHARRRKNGMAAEMSHLYQPIIFRYLHAANPVVRENALVMFVNAFPLESPQFSPEKKVELRDQQIQEFQMALKDDSPKMRCAAAKAVCRILYEWPDIIPVASRTEFINFLTHELCFDQSSSAVRIAVLEGLQFLLGRVESVESVVNELPHMGYLLHDPVEAVRRQFVKLLNTLSPLNGVNIFEIVHLDHLIYRLKYDTPKCALAICELLLPSMFPPLVEKGRQQKMKTVRVSRCVFLMRKNLVAAIKFYSLLPKLVSIEEVLYLLSYAYFWATKTAKGQQVKLQSPKLIDGENLVLPAFEDQDDLERQHLQPHEAIWAILSVVMQTIAKKGLDEEQLSEIRDKTFPNFDARKWLETLPAPLHPYLFKFVSVFKPTDDEIAMALDYLQGQENTAWADALRCLVQWKSMSTFFPDLVNTVVTVAEQGGDQETIAKLPNVIRYLSFIFSNNELRNCVIEDTENIRNLVEGLEKFVVLLFLKLNIDFDKTDVVNDKSMEIADQLTDECYIQALELTIALRVHLSLHLLQSIDDDESPEAETTRNEEFTRSIRMIHETVFTPVVQGILAKCSEEELTPPNLPYLVLQSLFTLIADMLSLHVLDGQSFCELVAFFTDSMDTNSGYGGDVKLLAYQCMSKIAACIATDPVSEGTTHPVSNMLKQMVTNVDNKQTYTATKQTVEALVKQQIKTRSLPWLLDSLSDIFADIDKSQSEHHEEEEAAEEDQEDDDERVENIKRSLRNVINEAIVKVSN